jgi:methyl-accepting chemotaxis protein
MNIRDWLSQIKVRLTALMLATVLLPLIAGLVWDLSQGGANWITRTLVSAVVGLICLAFGIVETRRISRRATDIGHVSDAFAIRGELGQKVSSEGRDELAWTAYSFNQMTKRMAQIAEAAEQAATGDLTVQIAEKSNADTLAKALNKMIANLRLLIGQVVDSATILGGSSHQLAAAAEQSNVAMQQIAATVQQVARGAAQQSESVARAAHSEEQLSRAVDSVAQGAQTQAAAIARASEIAVQITALMEQMTAQITRTETVRDNVKRSAQKVQEMGQRSTQIQSIADTIDDFASQTNMLALNAAIEAKRAEEHGYSFGVVANEVRQLAKRSDEATDEIGRLVTQMRRASDEAVLSINASAAEVEQYVTEIAAATQQMTMMAQGLSEAMDAASNIIESHTASTHQMTADSAQVSQEIENVASISQENSAAAEEVSAAIEEMNAQMEEVTASAQSLADMAQSLQQAVAQFRLSSEELNNRLDM